MFPTVKLTTDACYLVLLPPIKNQLPIFLAVVESSRRFHMLQKVEIIEGK